MARPTRSKQIPNLPDAIKEIAWQIIANYGAPTLSLRAIARELKITAPAIYSYFPSRDHLVTALAMDALISLEDSQKKSIELIPADKLEKRLTTLGLAYRDWAIQHQQHYQLIFSTTIPGYKVPDKSTIHSSAWAMLPLIETVQGLYTLGKLRVERLPKVTPGLKSMLKSWRESIIESGTEAHIEALYLAFVIWSRVHGLVTLELLHQTPPFVTDPGEIYRREIESIKLQYL